MKDLQENNGKKAIDIVEEVKKELNSYLSQFTSGWDNEERAYYGDIWKKGGKMPFENEIFNVVESEVPILTDSISGIVADTTDPEYMEQAKNLVKSIEWVLKKQNFQVKHPQVVRNSLISAPGFIWVDYDFSANKGDGGITLEVVPRSQVRLDGLSSFLEESEKNQVDLYKRKNWLKARYPGQAEQIENMKASAEQKDSMANKGRETSDTGGKNKRTRPMRHTADDILKLCITYIKDDSLEAIPEEETAELLQEEGEMIKEGNAMDVNLHQDHEKHIEFHEGQAAELKIALEINPEATFEEVEIIINQLSEENPEGEFDKLLMLLKINDNHIEEHKTLQKENPKGGQPKYPCGWRVIESIQKVVFYDGPTKFKHGEFPIIPWYCYKDDTVYGFGEVRNILDSQEMQAVMSYKEYKGLQRVANPGKAIFKESGITKDDITNEDGAVYEVGDASQIPVNITPGQVSEQVGRFSDKRSIKMQSISGVTEATQGKLPSGQISGVTVERVQTQAVGRVRLKERLNDYYSMKRLGRIIAANVLQYWTTERSLRLENKNGQFESIVFNPMEMQDLEYEIEIAPGSMAGVDKNSFNAMLASFLAAGHITFDNFLETAEIQKTDKLRELVSTEREKAEQLQQLQMKNIELRVQLQDPTLTEEEIELFEQSNNEGVN